jgi:acetyl esterase
MPLDPQVQALIASTAGTKPVEEMTTQEMRDSLEARARMTGGPPEAVAQVTDTTLPGPAGPLTARIYVPDAALPMPGLVFFHGGGWARGSLQTHDVLCRALANGASCVVISVDYRMAPEYQFPAAADDAIAATNWVAANADALGIDAGRLAVGGDSAGGNLAAAVALALRDESGPALAHQLLIYPVLNRDFETTSYKANATGYMLTRAAMQHYWRLYLREESDGDDPRASPLRAASLANLPAATIVTAEYDPLLDEGRAYAGRLRQAGVQVEYREYAGLVHGFATSAGAIDAGRAAVQDCASSLRAAFQSVGVGV